MRNMAFKKIVAINFLLIFINSLIAPNILQAKQDPPSPDFGGFESSSTRDMVSEFTGDFTYNLPVIEIPGPDGGGYSLSLSYHSGTSPEEDASWVGYGFTLSPGAINRNVRGYPDDYKSAPVTMYNKTPRNWTATAGVSGGLEIFSLDMGLSANAGLRYNNYSGFGYNLGAGISYNKGVVSLGYNVSDGEGSFSLSVNPAEYLSKIKTENKGVIRQIKGIKDNSKMNLAGSNYGLLSFSDATRPFSVHSYTGQSYNFSVGASLNPLTPPIGANAGVFGSYSYQDNVPSLPLKAYGLLYSSQAAGNDALMDYSLEKETTYNKRDIFLGIPFNNADNYVVSGEGIGGSFRMYHRRIGEFKPNKVESQIDITNIGGECDAGLNFGGGVDLGKGQQTLKVEPWNSTLPAFSGIGDDLDEPVFFRFTNDLGGAWEYPSSDEPIAAGMDGGGQAPGLKAYTPNLDNVATVMNSNIRSGRSSYIGYNLNSTFGLAEKKPYLYSKNTSELQSQGLDRTHAPDGIGEFSITNESGQQYVYGLPVYARNESNLRYGMNGVDASNIEYNYLAYDKSDDMIVGEVKNEPYASSYLLTAIYTPDYIDRTNDGPTDDDLGGFTKFNYTKKFGYGVASDNFFKWRTPYNGLHYDRGSLSDPMDDVGTVSQGEKEVYNLQSIETKSHVAIFTTSARQDGIEADISNNGFKKDQQGTKRPQELDRIDLYSKKDVQYSNGNWFPKANVKPIKTVRFSYDFSLCQGMPNTVNKGGKLTLKKVWFEYNGIAPDKISPYEFQYEYPFNRSDVTYPSKYNSLKVGYEDLTSTDQNPNYSHFNLDPWGNYQKDMQTDETSRFAQMKTWVNQTPDKFDPAAWQLKVIKLPTGGEIHVQYEQDDYKYVQDKLAHVMATASYIGNSFDADAQRKFTIDPKEMGITDLTDIARLRDVIDEMYVNGGKTHDKKMYFKFFYRLLGPITPVLGDCNTDYITGYAFVKAVGLSADSKQIIITLGEDGNNKTLPNYTCKDFVLSQRAGKLNPLGNCDPSTSGIQNPDAATIVDELLGFAATLTFPGDVCQSMSQTDSYLRIPVLEAKKGGGLRVKRLLMYDNNMGDPVLYGNEYIYKSNDKSSSGVAANEPGSNREENILVDYIKRGDQNAFSKIIAGRDKKQTEGPIGESVLPGPSVGYSQVYVRNIHSGNTGTGFSVKEFYTAKDFPLQVKYTDINTHNDYMLYPLLLFNDMVNNVWASQGFSFIRNDMHGQKKRDASYSGELDNNFAKTSLISEQAYEYFKPGESIPVSTSYGSAVVNTNCGKEVDLTLASKSVKDVNNDINVEVDLTVGILGIFPIPFFGAAPSFTRSEMELSTYAISKVINYPPVVKKLTTFNEGAYHTVENIAFDGSTGKPVTTKSYDEFSGTYLIQSIPGSWEYKNLQQKAINQGLVYKGFTYLKSGTDEFVSPVTTDCNLKNNLIPGDLIDLVDKQTNNGKDVFQSHIYHVQQFDDLNSRFKIVKSQQSDPTVGDPLNVDQLIILRSGRTNRLDENIGSFTLHSARNDIQIPQENASERWENGDHNTFISNLNTQALPLLNADGSTGTGTFTLSGPYDNVNIEPFISDISPECAVNLRNASIQNIEVLYRKSEFLQIKIISMELLCNGSWVKIEGKKE